MKLTIWKFELIIGHQKIMMPVDAKLLSVQNQNEKVCLWALVDELATKEEREFEIYGTGHRVHLFPSKNFIGTIQLENGSFVGHVFEILKQPS